MDLELLPLDLEQQQLQRQVSHLVEPAQLLELRINKNLLLEDLEPQIPIQTLRLDLVSPNLNNKQVCLVQQTKTNQDLVVLVPLLNLQLLEQLEVHLDSEAKPIPLDPSSMPITTHKINHYLVVQLVSEQVSKQNMSLLLTVFFL